MWLSTLQAMDDELVTDSLVYRYDPERLPGRPPRAPRARSRCARSPTSTRSPGPAGSTRRGSTFEKMLTYANHLGLYSEEIALTGEQIGNFPQAFTHLALIDAAITLDAPARPGAVQAAPVGRQVPSQRTPAATETAAAATTGAR